MLAKAVNTGAISFKYDSIHLQIVRRGTHTRWHCQESMFIMLSILLGATDGLLSRVIMMLVSSIPLRLRQSGKERNVVISVLMDH